MVESEFLFPTRRGLLAQGGLLGLAACARSSGGAGEPLRVAVYKGGLDGQFAAAGVAPAPSAVSNATFSGGNLITEAIDARAVDLGSMSEIPPVFVAGRPTLLRQVAVQQADVNFQMVLVPGQSSIRHPAELKGKRVGYVRATTSHYLLLRVLAENGLTLRDVAPVPLSPQDGLAAFRQGALDAWVIYDVFGYMARAGGARVLATGLGRMSGNYLWAALAPSIDDPAKRAAIADYLDRVRTTIAWIEHNPERWAKAKAADTGVDPAFYLQQFRERSQPTALVPVNDAAIRSQQDVADTFTGAGVLPARVDVRPLWSHALDGAPKA